MKALFVYEKFVQDSDPIYDMGIGIKKQIEDWLKTIPDYRYPDSPYELIDLVISYGKKQFFDYLLEKRKKILDKYELKLLLDKAIYRGEKKMADDLLNMGAKFKTLANKANYLALGNPISNPQLSLTPEQRMIIAANERDFKTFKKLYEKGVKLKIGMINCLYNRNWDYRTNYKQEDLIKKYLADRIDNIENHIHSRDIKKIDKIKELLNVKPVTDYKKLPHGYKSWAVLKFIDENHPKTRKEIIRYIFELNYGKGSFNPLLHSSYWSTGYQRQIGQYIGLNKRGEYELNFNGKAKLKKGMEKFKNVK